MGAGRERIEDEDDDDYEDEVLRSGLLAIGYCEANAAAG
jgi:hypothetical protein